MTETLTAAPKIETKGGLTPYLQLSNATEAAAFYEKAFGAKTVFAHPQDLSLIHI